jgi:hypothetical protein
MSRILKGSMSVRRGLNALRMSVKSNPIFTNQISELPKKTLDFSGPNAGDSSVSNTNGAARGLPRQSRRGLEVF